MKYARNVDGRWIDVHESPSAFFADLADLEKKLGVSGFIEVSDDAEHGDFVVGENGHAKPQAPEPPKEPEPIEEPTPEPPPEPSKAELLAKVEELIQAVSALK